MLGLDIRVTTLEDFEAVDGVLSRSYPEVLRADYMPSVLRAALPIISRAQPELLASGTYFAGFLNGQIVTAGGWTREAPGTGSVVSGVGHLRHVVSDPEHLRKGYARALMGRVVLDAKQAGVNVLQCQATLSAVAFYRACGFVDVEGIEIVLRPGIVFPALRMERVV